MAAGSDIRAGRAFVELLLRDANFTKGLQNASARLKDFGTGTTRLGGIITGAGAAILAPIGAMVKSFMDTGDALDKMRQRTGIGVQALSEFGHAAEQSGTDLETFEGAVRKMQKAIESADQSTTKTTGKGLGKMTEEIIKADEAFSDLGLSKAALQALSPEEQFNAIAQAIGKIKDPTERAAAAMGIFGKSGTKLLPMIEDLNELREEARRMGFTMTGEAAAAAVKLGDTLANLMKTVKFSGLTLAEVLVPSLQAGAEWIQRVASAAMRWVRENREMIVTAVKVGAALVAVGGALTGLGLTLSVAGIAVGGFVTTLGLAAKALGTLRLVMLPLHAAMAAGRAVVLGLQAAYVIAASSTWALRAATLAATAAMTAARGAVTVATAAYAGLRTIIIATTTAFTALRGSALAVRAAGAVLVGTVAAVRVGLGATVAALSAVRVGSLAAAAGMAVLSAVGTGLAILTSPLTLIAAGLVALGIAAVGAMGGMKGVLQAGQSMASAAGSWAQSIAGTAVAAFRELQRIGMQAFTGIKDAIAAGDFALAGKIALAGLKVAFLEGIAALSASVGGEFGDFLGTLGTQIAGGDFAGAWSTAVAGMSAVWDGFCQRIATVFTTAAGFVKQVWLEATSSIANAILGLSAKFPNLAKAVGLDVGLSDTAKQAKQDQINRANVMVDEALRLDKQASGLEAEGKTEEAAKLRDRIKVLEDEARKAISAAENITPESLLPGAQASAREQLEGQTTAFQAMLDDLDRKARERAEASGGALRERTEGGAGGAAGAAAGARAEFDRLTAEAARLNAERKAKEEADRAKLEGLGGEGGETPTARVAGTFSANFAQMFGGTGSPMEKVAKAAQETNDKLDDLLEIDKDLLREFKAGGQFTA